MLSAAPASLSAQALSRKEIEEALRYDKHPDPGFPRVDPDSLHKSIEVAAGRSYAVFGYNTPSVIVRLPAIDNSAYAKVEFPEAKPLGKDGKVLPHEIEKGLYDSDSHSTQVRFVAPRRKALVPLARAKGRVTVRYPVAVHTTAVRNSPQAADLGIAIDGPYVTYSEKALGLPEAAPFTGVEPLRAYDASGKRLERYDGFQKTELKNDVSKRTVAFWGPVASVRFDTVDSWSDLEIPFDLPAAPMRPAGREGVGL
jgi:hypothetical protein